MTLQIDLRPELEAKLRERAAAVGKDVHSFARDAVEKELLRPQTFAEILAPVHKAVRESGMSEEEVNALLQKALADTRRERKSKA
jgi:hypothetical protein